MKNGNELMNLKNEDFNTFKNDIYKYIHELENKLNLQISNKETKIYDDFQQLSNKMNSILQKNEDIVIHVVTQKLKLEKITELETFRKRVDDILLKHELRLKNILDDINNIKTTYDKIITENLYVPGFIGKSCQFRNLSEYVQYNINDISKIKADSDRMKRESKDLRNKQEFLMKNMVALNETTNSSCIKNIDNLKKEFKILLDNNIKEIDKKNFEMKTVIYQSKNDCEKNKNELQGGFNKLLDMKGELIKIIEEKFNDFQEIKEIFNQKIEKNITDLNINKNNIETLNKIVENTNKNIIKEFSSKIENISSLNDKLIIRIDKIENLINTNNFNTNDSKKKISTQTINKTKKEAISKSVKGPKMIGKNKEFNLFFSISEKTDSNQLYLKTNENFTYKRNNKNTLNSHINKHNNILKSSDAIQRKKIPILNKTEIKIDNQRTPKIVSIISKKNHTLPIINLDKAFLTHPTYSTQKRKQISNNIEGNKQIFSSETNINKSPKEKKHHLKKKIKDEAGYKSLIENKLQNFIFHKYGIGNNLNKRNNSKKINQRKEMFGISTSSVEKEKVGYKFVDLNLERRSLNDKKYDGYKENNITLKGEHLNSLLNLYRAKLFTKQKIQKNKTSPSNETNDLLNLCSQAFGRTTYTFYIPKKEKYLLIQNTK